MHFYPLVVSAIAVASLFVSPKAQLPTNFIEKVIASKSSFNEATSMAHADDGRIFVSERAGKIKMIKGDSAIDIYTVGTTTNREQGLLKIQVHPGFSSKSWIYAFYMTADNDHPNLGRIQLDANNKVIKVDTLVRFSALENGGRHNGSALVFGKDGFLYVTRGNDELGGNANPAANWNTSKGKILRLTDEGQPAPGNPHYNTAGASNDEKSIWARGFRNPWTMGVDPISGRLFVGDVGDGTEELSEVTAPDAGKDFWYGYGVGGGDGVGAAGGKSIDPIYYHPTNGAGECAIVAEVPYNSAVVSNWPAEYKNRIYVADYCGAAIRSVPLNNPASAVNLQNAGNGTAVFYPNSSKKVALNLGIDGNLYYVAYGGNGKAMMISYTGAATVVASGKNGLIVKQGLFQAGLTSDVTFSLSANITLPEGAQAEFSILAADGKTILQQSVKAVKGAFTVQGFRPLSAGVHIGNLRWMDAGNQHQAQGRLPVLF